jgi:hypothetical protein
MASVPLNKLPGVKIPSERKHDRKVVFTSNPDFSLPLLTAKLDQQYNYHDVLTLNYAGRLTESDAAVSSGDPVTFTWSGSGKVSTWVGYVHTVVPTTIGNNFTKIICVSPTYVFKNTTQKIYKNVTADQIVTKIAKKYGLKAVTQRHPRVFKSISQAGQSDWQVLRRLSKQTGFGLRVDGTTIYFMSKSKLSEASKTKASYFFKEEALPTSRAIVQMGTIYEFDIQLSDESPDMLGAVVERVISGVHDVTNKPIVTKHTAKIKTKSTKGAVVPSKKFLKK